MIDVCPHCDSSTGPKARSNRYAESITNEQYHCSACGHDFDELAHREAKTTHNGQNGLAKELLEADPDDF